MLTQEELRLVPSYLSYFLILLVPTLFLITLLDSPFTDTLARSGLIMFFLLAVPVIKNFRFLGAFILASLPLLAIFPYAYIAYTVKGLSASDEVRVIPFLMSSLYLLTITFAGHWVAKKINNKFVMFERLKARG